MSIEIESKPQERIIQRADRVEELLAELGVREESAGDLMVPAVLNPLMNVARRNLAWAMERRSRSGGADKTIFPAWKEIELTDQDTQDYGILKLQSSTDRLPAFSDLTQRITGGELTKPLTITLSLDKAPGGQGLFGPYIDFEVGIVRFNRDERFKGKNRWEILKTTKDEKGEEALEKVRLNWNEEVYLILEIADSLLTEAGLSNDHLAGIKEVIFKARPENSHLRDRIFSSAFQELYELSQILFERSSFGVIEDGPGISRAFVFPNEMSSRSRDLAEITDELLRYLKSRVYARNLASRRLAVGYDAEAHPQVSFVGRNRDDVLQIFLKPSANGNFLLVKKGREEKNFLMDSSGKLGWLWGWTQRVGSYCESSYDNHVRRLSTLKHR